MKQLSFALMLFCAVQVKAQSDTSKIDSVQTTLKIEDYQRIWQDINTQVGGKADVKPQEWQEILQLLYINTKPKNKKK